MILFVEGRERAGALNPMTYQEGIPQGEEEARIYQGAGVVIWTRHGTVDGVMTRENINLMIKNMSDFNYAIKQNSRISLLASIYTNFATPNQSQNYQSAIMVGKLEFNVIGLQEGSTLL